MKFRIASVIHATLAVAGIVLMFSTAAKSIPFSGPLVYAVIFVLMPLVASYGIWKEKVWGLVVGMLFFLPQCINYYGQDFSFRFMAPVSFFITSGVPGEEVILINLFAIGMVVFLMVLLKLKNDDVRNAVPAPGDSAE